MARAAKRRSMVPISPVSGTDFSSRLKSEFVFGRHCTYQYGVPTLPPIRTGSQCYLALNGNWSREVLTLAMCEIKNPSTN